MATIIYKKFFKKDPGQPRSPQLCEQQQNVSHTSQVPDSQDSNKEKTPDTSSNEKTRPCEICKQKASSMRKYRWKLIAGLSVPFLIQSLDTTIIAGALPYIASEFNELSQINWIVSAYNLTAVSFIPFWGQFADIFGRYVALQTAMIILLIGSTLCSAAPTTAFPMLLLGRALQGIGSAGALIVTKTVLADKVSLKENAKNNTLFTIVAGVGYGIGPVVGGYLTEVSWRWCFIINIPIAVVGIAVIHFVLRSELLGAQKIARTDGGTEVEVAQTFKARVLTIDFGGQFLFLFGIGLFILALTWAGSLYQWSSTKVIAPLVTGVILIISFLFYEYLMVPGSLLALKFPTQKSMIPLTLVCTRNASILMCINFITGMAMYAVFYFVGVYFSLVKNFSPGQAGQNLLYYLPGLGGGAYLAMFACNKFPRQTFHPLFLGTFIESLGIILLAISLSGGNLSFIYGMLASTGVGTGLRFMPGTLHGVGYFPQSIANIVSLMSFSISLGGAISTTLLFNILYNTINTSSSSSAISSSTLTSSTNSYNAINSLPQATQEALRNSAKKGIILGFFALSAFSWLGVILMLGLGNVWIRQGGGDGGEGDGEDGRGGDKVVRGSYFGSFHGSRRRVGSRV